MKTFISTLIVVALAGNVLAQIRQNPDSTKAAKPTNQPINPNTQRNGYETYQSTSQIVGTGPYTMVNTIDNRYEGLRGTPYFLPEWNKGRIDMVAGQNYKDVPIKFDAFRQQLILLRTWVGNDSIIVNADQVKAFQFQNAAGQSYLFERVPMAKTDDQAAKNGYFLVLYKGKTALLKRIVKQFKKADYKDPYSNDVRYDAFRDAFAYYVLKPDQTLVKVKLSEKSLIDALNDRQDALKAFAKQEKLSFKTENDAITLVKQYDSL
ncbi:hypothetical protein GCM10027341_19070 [Spirosoma knui]